MKLKALSLSDLEQVRLWRNEQPEHLRTAFPLTAEMQEQFYHEVICNRQANARYWGIWVEEEQPATCDIELGGKMIQITSINVGIVKKEVLIGMGGIENIQFENRLGEISLLIDLEKMKYWEETLQLILQEAFTTLNLENVYTEVYDCSPIKGEWAKASRWYKCDTAILSARKYYQRVYYSSTYINFNKERVLALC